MQITRTSILTGTIRTKEIDVTQEQLDRYYHTPALIQDVFPHLSDDDREFIKTGIADGEWEEGLSEPAEHG